MAIKLLELRKFAIEKGADVSFKDNSSGELCMVDKHGIARIPGKNTFKEPFKINIDEAVKTATEFIIEDGKGRQVVTAAKIGEIIAEALKPKTQPAHKPAEKKEED
ncbi:MAG: hypothetical protein L0Y68_08095 [Candidatus Dadabacteria bacterium]|nr:hypothetical protein [Candidatus Dadabacteria bacterium]